VADQVDLAGAGGGDDGLDLLQQLLAALGRGRDGADLGDEHPRAAGLQIARNAIEVVDHTEQLAEAGQAVREDDRIARLRERRRGLRRGGDLIGAIARRGAGRQRAGAGDGQRETKTRHKHLRHGRLYRLSSVALSPAKWNLCIAPGQPMIGV